MIVTTAVDGVNCIYICSWMTHKIRNLSYLAPGNFEVYPDSRNARELRTRVANWPIALETSGESSFGTGNGSGFINRFLQFDILFIDGVRCILSRSRRARNADFKAHEAAAGGFREDILGAPYGDFYIHASMIPEYAADRVQAGEIPYISRQALPYQT